LAIVTKIAHNVYLLLKLKDLEGHIAKENIPNLIKNEQYLDHQNYCHEALCQIDMARASAKDTAIASIICSSKLSRTMGYVSL